MSSTLLSSNAGPNVGSNLGSNVSPNLDPIPSAEEVARVRSSVQLHRWVSFFALYRREMKRFMKVIFQTVVTPLINSSLYLLIFGVSLGKSIHMEGGYSYLSFLIPGLVMMGVLNNAFQNSSSSVTSGKFSGDLEDLKVVPLTPNMILWAMAIGGLTRGLLVGFITFLVGFVFQYAVENQLMSIAHPFALIYFLIIGGLTFSMLGVAVAFWAKTFDQMSAITSFVLQPLIYLGGVFFSIRGLNPFWQGVSSVNPVLYLINGVRFGFLGATDVAPVQAVLLSGAALIFFYVLAHTALKRGDYSRW